MVTVIRWSKDNIFKAVKILGLSLIPLILFIVPSKYIFENGHSLCLFKNISGTECYGCGMTRAVFSVLHFDFTGAFHYNKGIIAVMPLLVYVWIKMLYQSIRAWRR